MTHQQAGNAGLVEHDFEIGVVEGMGIAELEKNEDHPVGVVGLSQMHQFVSPARDAGVLGRADGPLGVAFGDGRNRVAVLPDAGHG